MILLLQAPQAPNGQITGMVEEGARLAKEFSARKWPMLAFLDTHYPDKPEPPYPPHCIIGTGEENLIPGISFANCENCLAFFL